MDEITALNELIEATNLLVCELGLGEATFEAVFYGFLGFELGERDPDLDEQTRLYEFFKRWHRYRFGPLPTNDPA